jgi:transcription factor IIIB 90 kDa subunit
LKKLEELATLTLSVITYNATFFFRSQKKIATSLWHGGGWFCEQTKDEVGSANNEEEMEFDALFGPDNAAGETVDDGYNYNYGGYDDDGAEGYNGLDDDFDF